jgi:hypothetical protein
VYHGQRLREGNLLSCNSLRKQGKGARMRRAIVHRRVSQRHA